MGHALIQFLAWEIGCPKFTIKVDNTEVVSMVIVRQMSGGNTHSNLLDKIWRMVGNTWKLKINHIFREVNMVIDFITRKNHD